MCLTWEYTVALSFFGWVKNCDPGPFQPQLGAIEPYPQHPSIQPLTRSCKKGEGVAGEGAGSCAHNLTEVVEAAVPARTAAEASSPFPGFARVEGFHAVAVLVGQCGVFVQAPLLLR